MGNWCLGRLPTLEAVPFVSKGLTKDGRVSRSLRLKYLAWLAILWNVMAALLYTRVHVTDSVVNSFTEAVARLETISVLFRVFTVVSIISGPSSVVIGLKSSLHQRTSQRFTPFRGNVSQGREGLV